MYALLLCRTISVHKKGGGSFYPTINENYWEKAENPRPEHVGRWRIFDDRRLPTMTHTFPGSPFEDSWYGEELTTKNKPLLNVPCNPLPPLFTHKEFPN